MLTFLFFCIGLINCQIIDDKAFSDSAKASPSIPATIGNYEYKFIERDILHENITFFSEKSIQETTFGLYPYNLDLPRITSIKKSFVSFKSIDNKTENRQNSIKNITKIIQNKYFNQDFPKELINGISYTYRTECQILFVWNKDKTFLILIYPSSIQKFFNISLGRGLMQHNYFQNILSKYAQNSELIFEISTSTLIRIGCQNISSNISNENSKISLSLSKYRLHNLGGERIYIQGPCFNESETIPELKIKYLINPGLSINKFNLTFHNSINSFSLLTPPFWYTGLYEFKMSYNNFDFISNVEIYSIDDEDQVFKISEIDQMNNPNYKKDISINIEKFNTLKISFYISDLLNDDKNKVPLILLKNEVRISMFEGKLFIEMQNLCNSEINIYRHIGFLAYLDQLDELKWTNSFSLIWCNYTINSKNSKFNESQCNNYLSKSRTEKIHICPDNSIKARNLLSTFRKMENDTKYLSTDLKDYDCFVQVLLDYEAKNGVTCCYNKATNNTIYGQDYYLRNNSLAGSYSWTVSPIHNLMEHFIRERIPLYSCCSIINNESLCSKFWDEINYINIKNFAEDFRANIFGDPHIIPYNQSLQYTFGSWGEFQLIVTKDNQFTLQGRFHHENQAHQTSFLKAIAFSIPSIQIFIEISNNRSNLHWKIENIGKKSIIETLPFYHEGVLIYQSKKTKILNIYIRFGNNYRIYIELDQHFYLDKNLEYMNMKIHLSNNMKDIINGGLFGRIDGESQNTWLFKQNSSDSIINTDYETMFNFSNTWRLKAEDKRLFFDSFKAEIEIYKETQYPRYQSCNELKMCDIDRSAYPEDNAYQETAKAYEYRVMLDNDLIIGRKGKVCDHPIIKMVKYSSDNFTETSEIFITSCIGKDINVTTQSSKCTSSSGSLVWIPEFKKDLCNGSQNKTPDSKNDSTLIYAGVGASIFCIIGLIFIVLYILVYRKRRVATTSKNNLELSETSIATIPTVYDTVITNVDDDDYSTYAAINKENKN